MRDRHGGLVKPDIVFFGESLPERFFRLMKQDFAACDLLIVMGTSLMVQPFASLIDKVEQNVPRILINRDEAGVQPEAQRRYMQALGMGSGFEFAEDARWRDVFLRGDCDDGVRGLADELGWTADLDRLFAAGQQEFAEKNGAPAAKVRACALTCAPRRLRDF